MKKILVLSVAILIAFSASAQKFGVKAGYGMSGYLINFYSPDGSVMSTGLNAGLVAELDLEVIAVRADVTFNQLGSDFDSRNNSEEDWPYGAVYEYEYKQNINYLNIGVSVKKGFGPAYVFVGPYFGYALQGVQKDIITPVAGEITEWTGDIYSDPTDYNPLEPITDDNNFDGSGDLYNKVDFGANLGLGASFSGVFVEANVGYGFMNFINHDSEYYDINSFTQKDAKTTVITEDAKQNNLFFGLSLGYMFGE